MEKKMNKAIAYLAYTRKVMAEYKDEVAQVEAELKETGEWKYLEQRREYLETARADVADAEASARKTALKIFAETGVKAPHPTVNIKIYTILEYNDKDAVNYAREHLPEALKLDKRIFKKAARVIAMDFVAITQEPRAIIARDLSKYLGGQLTVEGMPLSGEQPGVAEVTVREVLQE